MNHSHRETPEWMICKTCQLPLDSFQPANGGPVEYLHPTRSDTTYDHEPAPVPREGADHVVVECDFCSSPEVAWIYPTREPMSNVLAVETRRKTEEDRDTMRDHTIRRQRMTGHEELRENRFSPDWAACGPCSTLIDRYDPNALVSRVSKLLPTHPPQNLLRKLYREFMRKSLAKRAPDPSS